MKLFIDENRSQPDPYVIKNNGKYYMYATHVDGVQLYESDDMLDWAYKGLCFTYPKMKNYWAPAVLNGDGKFYLYASFMPEGEADTHLERLFVAESAVPEGPFAFVREMAKPFSIDPHVVLSGGKPYIFYSINDYEAERAGTLIVVDAMKSFVECEGSPKVVVRATLDEEIFKRDRFRSGQHWHTLEGAFYIRKGNNHYVTYSGNCYENPNYYIGYAVASGDTDDLKSLDFKKYPAADVYYPLLAKNEFEEGTGHNSILEENGKYYLFYHGRDYSDEKNGERRTARYCEIELDGGVIRVVKR